MIDWIRRDAFPFAVVIATAIIIGSCVHTFRALGSLPLIQARIAKLDEQLFRLQRLEGTLASATSRLRALAVGGDKMDQQLLAQSMAQGKELLDGLLNSEDVRPIAPLLAEAHEHLEEVRTLASDIPGIDLQERAKLREQMLLLRSQLDAGITAQMQEQNRLQYAVERERRRAVGALLGGHALLLAVAPETIARLTQYPWPGNVRELQGVIKQTLLRASSPIITPMCLPPILEPSGETCGDSGMPLDDWKSAVRHRSRQLLAAGSESIAELLHQEVDRVVFAEVLHATNGNLSAASSRLGISRPTLRTRLKQLGLRAEG